MAATCPCGCGNRLTWARRRLASNGVDVLVRVPAAERLGELIVAWAFDPEELRGSQEVCEWIGLGREMGSALVQNAHDGSLADGDAIPSLSETVRWISRIQKFLPQLPIMDVDWWEWYQERGAPAASPMSKHDLVAVGSVDPRLIGAPQPASCPDWWGKEPPPKHE